MWEAHLKRRAVDELRQSRDMNIAAYHANPTWDEKENRPQRDENIRQLREQFQDAMRILYAPRGEKEPDAFEDDPLFAPLARQRRREAQAPPQMPNEGRADELVGGVDPALGI